MQTLRFLFGMGALAAVILPLQLSAAPDNAEQAKMREALRQLLESNPPPSQPAAAAITPAPVPAPTPAPAPARVPVPVPPPVAQPPARNEAVFGPVPPPSRPGVSTVVPTAQPSPAALPTALPTALPVAAEIEPPIEQPMFGPVPPPNDGVNMASACELMRQKVRELEATESPATPYAPTLMTYTAIQVPSSPLSASQQSRLAELLIRYKADTITAQEYHKERAAIIAGP